ncbi:DUF3450 domain-containing protein [Halapricum desulfuricans]|nr:DUF3450 domain-containing protein [Halapricum desulfuricans]
MSSEPADSNPESPGDDESNSPRLTIALPDGSTSVSDAIVTNREMLREPQEHGLATQEEITHLSEAIEGLSEKAQTATTQSEQTQASVDELQAVVERQRRQIEELQSMVSSLADILGTEAEWETFDDA